MVVLNSRLADLTIHDSQDELHPEDIDKFEKCLKATKGRAGQARF